MRLSTSSGLIMYASRMTRPRRFWMPKSMKCSLQKPRTSKRCSPFSRLWLGCRNSRLGKSQNKILVAVCLLMVAVCPFPAGAVASIDVKAGFIRAAHTQETLSILDIPAADDGFAGAKLATEDNNTTGRFLGQTFSIEDVLLRPGDDPAAALNGLAAKGVSFILADPPPAELLALAGAAKD